MLHSEASDEGKGKEVEQPAGGYDDTPIPRRGDAPGWSVKITFHRATNLPVADYASRTSDPYVLATLKTDIPSRHPNEDPEMVFRTPTVQKNVNPEWECAWIVANIPESGFELKARVRDEDPGDFDDRLGHVHINVDRVSATEGGFKEQSFKIDNKTGSVRANAVRFISSALTNRERHGNLVVSVELLGRTEGEGGRVYTVGPMHWSQHFSPLIGILAGTKEKDEKGIKKSNFEANQIQLQGPVPAELYHRYVEFKKFVKGMFQDKGLRGKTLNAVLHRQHQRIYIFDSTTKYGTFEKPSEEVSKKFLEMVHHDEGARVYTYVLLLDGKLRFTETGKEFGIDLLSKHTMHSDVSQFLACSGEFFIRRVKNPKEADKPIEEQNETHPAKPLPDGPPHEPPPIDPRLYELIIDNDSGTYRPNGNLLPVFGEFLQKNLVGLKVITMACDDEKLQELKTKQRERKKKEGDKRVYRQRSNSSLGSSISSDDVESLQSRANEGGVIAQGEEETVKGFKKLGLALKNPKDAIMNFATEHS